MLSLDATREEAEVRRFDTRLRKALGDHVRYVVEEKFDGVSVELVYEGSVLARAVTRGDGHRGEGITENVKTIRSVPLCLRNEEREVPPFLALRGEVLMNISAFKTLNRQLLEAGEEPFANPRNAASGSLRQLDPRITGGRPLEFVAYEVLAVEGKDFTAHTQALQALRAWGLRVPERPAVVTDVDAVLEYHARWTAERLEESGRRRQAPLRMPAACPACGANVVQRGPYTVCPNRFGCRAQLKRQIQHFASKGALDIGGLGLETVSTLVDCGLVKNVADVFRLDADDLRQLEGFAERSARRLVETIHRRKHVELRRFLYGLGIPEVGTAVAHDLADHFGSLDAVRQASRQALEGVPSIGPELSKAMRGFFAEARNQQAIDALLEAGVQVVEPTASKAQPLARKTFVFTGALDRLSRREAEQEVEALGARATAAVSGETDYVVVGKDPGQKLEAAKSRGAQILTEPQYIALLREAGVEV